MVNLLERWIGLGTVTSSWMYEIVGNHLFAQNRYKKAEKLYLKFNSKYPKKKFGIRGLVKVARAQNKWKIALERLDMGIRQFPEEVDFYFQKISILMMLNKIEAAKAVLKTAKDRFPLQLPILLAEARMLQKEYAYQAAQAVLNIGVENYPEHQDLSVYQGYNYWLLGEYQKAIDIFDRIRPKLNLKRGFLHTEFSIPYINLLLKGQRLEELKLFFEEVLSANIWNREILFGYCQLLISRREFERAKSFIENVLKEKDSNVNMVHQLLLEFELEKIQNLVAWGNKNSPLSESENSLKASTFLDKLDSILHSFPALEKSNPLIFNLFQKFKELTKNHPSFCLNTAASPTESYRVASAIVKAIRNNTPFSLIRLGDGEGSYLPYSNDLNQFQKKDQEINQHIWWGKKRIDEKEWAKIQNSYIKALEEADILGVPDPMRCIKTFLSIAPNQPISTSEARGLFAIFNFIEKKWKFSEHVATLEALPLLTSCHIHSHLADWNLWDRILNEVSDCSVISCHEDLVPLLKEKHRITVLNFYKIPSEYKYAQLFDHSQQKENPHYPDRFEEISKNIYVSYPGEVFIVAAGFLGKIYCNMIKQKGGIAIDAGSAVDYWLEYKTRVWTHFPIPINYDHVA